MSTELALVDSNVLVYAFHEEAEHHAASRSLLNRGQRGGAALCIASQNLAEFYAITTNPKRVTKPRQAGEALDAVKLILAMPGMTLIPTPADIVERWVTLVHHHPVTRGNVYDAQLAATMLANNVRQIYTYDVAHFRRFPEIEVLTP